MDLAQLIKDYFYNFILNHILDSQNATTRANLPGKLKQAIISCIRVTLNNSQNVTGIFVSPINFTMANCPPIYHALLGGLLALKNQVVTEEALHAFAETIMATPAFQTFDPSEILISDEQSQQQEQGVTAELIRRTFYNAMVSQAMDAVEEDWMSQSDIEDEEPNIYFALPALTLIEAVITSSDCNTGFRLLENKIFTSDNCPDEKDFKALHKALSALKPVILKLTENELRQLKYSIASNTEIPQEQSAKLNSLRSNLQGMSIEISQNVMYRTEVKRVVNYYLEIAKLPTP